MRRFSPVFFCVAAVSILATQSSAQVPDIAFATAAANGQVYIAGQVVGAIPGQRSFGSSDSFVAAYTADGAPLWTVEFGAVTQDFVNGVAADATGVYIAGLTNSKLSKSQTEFGSTDAYVAKYDLNGKQLWLHQFGGTGVDRLQAAASDGTFLYVAGYTTDALYGNTNVGGQDCFVQKWDQSGNLLWTTEFGSSGTDRAYGIAVNSTGVFITGRTDGAFPGWVSFGGLDAFVAELDFNGNMVWLTQFGTSADERGWGIGVDANAVYVTGRTEGAFPNQAYLGDDDAYFAQFDLNGNQVWLDEFGNVDFNRGTAAATDATGAYGVGLTDGALPGQTSKGSRDCYVRKWDTGGNVLWTVQFGSPGYDTCWGVATDSTGVYVSGTAGGRLPHQMGPSKPNGYFVEKFDQNGNSMWTQVVAVPQQ